ncbi:MAG TPA: hypothetical protein VLK36_16595 [Gaiellaceae bacterium]|nr:hypothetical protein [Gaiellaceae bacterium]
MRPRRLHAVVIVVVVCALAVGGVVAALLITGDGHTSTTDPPTTAAVETTGVAPTTGDWAPITVTRPKLPVIGGGIPVDIDPLVSRTDFNTTLSPVGPDRYRMTIFNTSSLGAINSLQWYPPVSVRIVKVLGSSAGRCVLTGLSGFGGNQFPTIVLYPNIFCDRLDLKPATCICRGDGGALTITFRTNKHLEVNDGDLRLRTATVAFERIPLTPRSGPPPVRHVMRIAAPHAALGGLTAGERADAQRALDGLQDSNISFQLAAITTKWAQNAPATCRVGLVSRNPSRFEVYIFWVPWLAAEPYIWLNMKLADDPTKSTFTLGTTQPVLPGGRLTRNGRSVNRLSVDTTLLARYGQEQTKKGRRIMVAHAGGVLSKPGATCEVLKNGSLELVPS